MPGFCKAFQLYVSANSGGLLVYVEGSLPARATQACKLLFDIQALSLEIKMRKEK